jgi:hypothetical protein
MLNCLNLSRRAGTRVPCLKRAMPLSTKSPELRCNQKRNNTKLAQMKKLHNPRPSLDFEQRTCDALTELMRVFRDFDNFRKMSADAR